MKHWFPALALAAVLIVRLSAAGLAAETRMEVHPPGQDARAGEEFRVTVELTGNPGFSSVQFKLIYDTDSMECLRVSTGPLLDGTIAASNPRNRGGASVAATIASVISGDGVLAELTFQARRDLNLNDFHFSLEDVILAVYADGANIPVPYTVTGADAANPTSVPTVIPAPLSTLTPVPTVSAPTATLTPVPTAIPGGAFVPESPAEPDTAPDITPAAVPNPVITASRFTDIADSWAEDSILRCEAMGLFDGFPAGEFHPNDPIDRGSFIAALWNLSGRPSHDAVQTPFTDIANCRQDVQTAIAWAFANGYINGTTPDTFTPDGPLTRQAAMKVLFGAAGAESGTETLFTDIYDQAFQDSGLLADWAKAPVYWGVYNTIINGNTPTTLNPGGLLSGAQLAVIMLRYTDRFSGTGIT